MSNIKIKYISLLIISFSSLQAQVLPLDSVLANIEKGNPSLQVFGAKINALNSYAEGAKSWEAPKISSGFWMTPYNPNLWKTDSKTGLQGMGSYMISAEQMIPNGQKLKAKQDYMLSMSLEQSENKNYIKNQLFAEAKINYYEWIILKKKLAVLKENESVINLMIQSAEAHYSYNNEKVNTIYKAKARLAEIMSMILMVESEIQQKRIALNTLMNRNKNLVFETDTIYQIKNYENNIPDSISLFQRRSDLKGIDRSADILKLKQDIERVKSKPDFGVSYAHMFSFGQANVFSLMGTITVPIVPWASKEYKSNIKGIDYEIAELKWQKQNITNEVMGKLVGISVAIKSAKKQIKAYDESIIPALRNNLKTSQLAYEQNTENLFVVLDAWEALNMAKIEFFNKVNDLLKFQVEYERELEQK